ncbi:MAG TPA: efflux RND transporter permease subunit [Acidobacteriota bacterium]|nr:efflux RND transporter permease subunit [Acidobacteriota bacterium]
MHGLAKLCIKRPVFATMLILAFIVSGIFAYFSLGVDRMPQIDAPYVMVTVANPGASPEEVETEITKKIEDAVNSISGLNELNSTSAEGMAQISIEFDLSKDGNVAAQEVQNKINQIVNDLPSSAKVPVITKMDLDASSVLQIAISAPRSTRDLTMIADKLMKQKLENCNGVGQVKIQGGANREIHIVVNPERLRAYNLTVTDVFRALQSQNMEMPGGSIKAGEKDFTVRTSGKIKDPADFGHVAIADRNGYTVKVSDIGYSEDSAEEPTTAVRLDGEPAVQLAVYKQSGTNTVEVAEAVKERLAQIRESVPKDVKVQIISDQSIFVKATINKIRDHLFEGSLLAAIVLYFFLANWRTTVIAAIAIPVSIISAFSIMAIFKYTMNQITMLALTLMVGVVVDDAIIVLENIYRHMEEKKMGSFEAAERGTKEIGLAVLATTVSLLAVFVPVGFMGGMTGRFMSAFGFTCAGAVVVSMLVSFTLTPMLCSRFVHPPSGDTQHRSKDVRFFRILDTAYTKALVWAMGHRKVIVMSCAAVILSILPLFMVIGKNMMTKDDQSQFNVTIRLPEGSSLAETTKYSETIARKVRTLEGVTHTLNTVGGGNTGSLNESSIFVKLVDIQDRKLSADEMATKVREMMKNHPPEIFLSAVAASGIGGGGMSDIQYYLQGPDIKKLAEYSDKIVARAKTVPGLGDIDSSLRSGKPEVQLDIDRARAADLGVSVQSIQQALNTLVAGQTASTFNAGNDQYDVVVQAESRFRGSVEGLEKMTVASTKTGSVGLNEVVRSRTSSGPSSIKRLGRQRIVQIMGNLLPGGSTSTAVRSLERFIAELNMGPDYKGGATGITGEMNKAAFNFAIAFALAFIFMYIALAAQFESFIHPVTILISLPLAVPFGLLSMLVTGQVISIMSGLGLLLLFGIVKKNAILQIDHMNGLRAAGMSRYEAIIQANRDRLRPILMTTMALVCGMIPLLISRGAGASTNHSIGWMVAGGQTLCLGLTLLAVPVFYSIWEDLGLRLRSIRLVRWPAKRAVKSAASILMITIMISASFAQTPSTVQTGPTPDSVIIEPLREARLQDRIGIETVAKITLKDVIEKVLANDPELAISQIYLEQAGYNIKSSQGYFDPVVGMDATRSRTSIAIASAIGGSASGRLTSKELLFTPRISGNTPWLGSTYSLTFSDSRQESDNTFSMLNPQYPTSVTLNFTQPLWRGLRIDAGRRSLLVARKNHELSSEQFRQRVIERVTQAVQFYWELAYARQNLEVQKEGVRLAEEQYESNRRQAEQGLLAPIEVVAAQTEVATFEQTMALAQDTLTAAENNLKQMMLDPVNPLWKAALIPETLPDPDVEPPPLKDALAHALASRPELAEQSINMAISKLDTQYYKDQMKPRVDAIATFAAAGLAGTKQVANPFEGFPIGDVPPHLLGGNLQSLSNIWDGRYPTAKVGIQISLPLRNRTAAGNAANALAEGRRMEIVKKQTEMYVEADVRNALEQWNTARARHDAARIASRAAEAQYASEQRQFQAGTSTMFLVFQRQNRYIIARSSEVRARADLAEAIANVDRATARTLDTHGIKLDQ